MYNIGMHLHRQTRKKPIIDCAIPDKHKHMIIRLNLPKYRDRQEHKWKNKDCLLIKEQIKQYSQACISIVKCGNKEEIKQLYMYKD